MSQGDDKKKEGAVAIETAHFRLVNAGNLARQPNQGPAESASGNAGQGKPISMIPFTIKAVAAAKAAVQETASLEGGERRKAAFRDLKNRQNMVDRSRRSMMRGRILKLLSYFAICVSLLALSHYWDTLFPEDLAAEKTAYHRMAPYGAGRISNLNRRVLVEGLRYDLKEIASCPTFCSVYFRDDHKNQILLSFRRNQFYRKLREIDGRVDVKGVLLKNKEGLPVLKVHQIEATGGIDIYKIIGIE